MEPEDEQEEHEYLIAMLRAAAGHHVGKTSLSDDAPGGEEISDRESE